ncbi:hypothetical protein L195_g025654 [Trifolium pratense]|uniref:Uncharacterized protein n=1 Tax=Trifolium pratense TaxID=57577 RepID=A0A2K3NH23_TRIPR|nr:hypothetical protein L195_g025654 [Trifolium pratense]
MPNTTGLKCVDINGGWSGSENLIASGLADLGGDSETILEFWVGPKSTLQNWLVSSRNAFDAVTVGTTWPVDHLSKVF